MATSLVRTGPSPCNPARLHLDLETAGVPAGSVVWAGYAPGTDRRVVALTAPTVIGTRVQNGVRTQDIAQPGELRFTWSVDLTPAQVAALDTALATHVPTNLTPEQVRTDQDESDWTQLQSEFAAFDAANNATKFAILKRAIRLVLRSQRQAPV